MSLDLSNVASTVVGTVVGGLIAAVCAFYGTKFIEQFRLKETEISQKRLWELEKQHQVEMWHRNVGYELFILISEYLTIAYRSEEDVKKIERDTFANKINNLANIVASFKGSPISDKNLKKIEEVIKNINEWHYSKSKSDGNRYGLTKAKDDFQPIQDALKVFLKGL